MASWISVPRAWPWFQAAVAAEGLFFLVARGPRRLRHCCRPLVRGSQCPSGLCNLFGGAVCGDAWPDVSTGPPPPGFRSPKMTITTPESRCPWTQVVLGAEPCEPAVVTATALAGGARATLEVLSHPEAQRAVTCVPSCAAAPLRLGGGCTHVAPGVLTSEESQGSRCPPGPPTLCPLVG